MYIAYKKGIARNTLPFHILNFYNNIWLRLFRLFGGLSSLALLTQLPLKLNTEKTLMMVIYIILIINTFAYSISHILTSIHRYKHLRKLIRDASLDLRNSPLDRLASTFTTVIACSKGICDATQSLAIIFSTMAGIDSLYEYKGRDPIFKPFISDMFKKKYRRR